MIRTRFPLAFSVSIALVFNAIATTTSCLAEDNAAANQKTAEIYKIGDRYLVELHQQAGRATFALVEARDIKPAPNGQAGPDLADLMQKGAVVDVIRIDSYDATETIVEQRGPSASKPNLKAVSEKRTRKPSREKLVVVKEIKVASSKAAVMLGTVMARQTTGVTDNAMRAGRR